MSSSTSATLRMWSSWTFATKAFPDIPLQKITQMVGGIDVIIYQPDEELKKLAKLSIDLGVDEISHDGDCRGQCFKGMGASEKGKKWLGSLQRSPRSLVPRFHRDRLVSPRRMLE